MDYAFPSHVVLRAAGWPMAALSAFGAKDLGDRALKTSPSNSDWREFVQQYGEVLSCERRALWQRTVEDDHFSKALLTSNLDLGRRLLRETFSGTRNKRARHLDTTLYRYLVRACTRTEPCGMWAGVTLGKWGTAGGIKAVPRRYSFTPDLTPFRRLVRSLAKTPRYRETGSWKLNPTFSEYGREEFSVWVHDESERCVEKRGRLFAGMRQVVKCWAETSSAAWVELRDRAAGVIDAPTEVIDELLRICVHSGVLIGGLSLPLRFRTAWHALAEVANGLREPERSQWRQCVLSLRKLARTLERKLDVLSTHEVAALLERASEPLRTLSDALEIDVAVPARGLLHCDMLAPFEAELSPELRQRCLETLREYVLFEQQYGLGFKSARAHTNALLEDMPLDLNHASRPQPSFPLPGDEVVECWEALCDDLEAPELASVVLAWSTWRREKREIVPRCGGSAWTFPYGAFALRLGKRSALVTAHAADVSGIFSRFSALFAPLAGRRLDVLAQWYADVLRGVERAGVVSVLEVVAPFEPSPNVQACPNLGTRFCCLGETMSGESSIYGSLLAADESAGIPVLRIPGEAKPVVVCAFSVANYSALNPLMERLLLTSERAVPFTLLAKDNIPFRCELDDGARSPAIRLNSGARLCRARTILSGEALSSILDSKEAARFRHWQVWSRGRNLPEVLLMRHGHETPIAVLRDSPLSIESVFSGLERNSRYIIIEELSDDEYVQGPANEQYCVEIAVPYVRPDHPWIVAALGAAQREPGPHDA